VRSASLRFARNSDKRTSLKGAVLDRLLGRAHPHTLPNHLWALRDVNLRLDWGDRVGLIGSNGAGKSTLLRLIARIYPPTTGTVTVRGTVAPLIEMGAGFNPELSGEENIFLNGAMLGLSKRAMRGKVDGIYEFTGLREFADLPLKYYSSGMYMRLAFGVATEVDPEVLLIDESLSVGDAAFVERAKQRLRGLLGRANAVVLVSHDLESLRELCTRGVWMKDGRVQADGPIDEVVDGYKADVAVSSSQRAVG
jgi:ABC-type polysaccharide/polyol phosphate transport system ATPase subunit